MESNMIVFLSLSFPGIFGFFFIVYLDYLERKRDHYSKIKILEGQKFELEHRLKNQSDIIRTLMEWKKEDEKKLTQEKS